MGQSYRIVRILILLMLINWISYDEVWAQKKESYEFFNNGLALTPPMGWSSWNTFRLNPTEKIIKEIADAMVSNGMKDAGYEYVNVDVGWALGRDSVTGKIIVDSIKFPSGMKSLANYIHSKGLKAGIYSDIHAKGCGTDFGSEGYYEEDAKQFAEWGFDYLKVDCCNAREWTEASFFSAYSAFSEALEKCGRPILYSACTQGECNTFNWAYSVANTWRVGHDIDYSDWKNPENNSFWNGILYELDLGAKHPDLAGPGHWNDLDMMLVGGADTSLFERPFAGTLSFEEEKAHFSLWCIMSSPLIAGNDIRTMSNETRSILTNKEAIAINQDKFGKQGVLVKEEDGLQVYMKPLESSSSGKFAVALFNRTDKVRDMTVTPKLLGLNRKISVRDIWEHKNMGTFKKYKASVSPHEVKLLVIH